MRNNNLGEVMENTETQTTANAETAAASLTAGLGGILGVKAGMTQVYAADGRSLAVTVLEIKRNTVTQVKKADKHGYSAVQVGFLPKKESRVNSAEKGHFKKSGFPGFYHAQEFR